MKNLREIINLNPFPFINTGDPKLLRKYLSYSTIQFVVYIEKQGNISPTLKNIYDLRNINPSAALELILVFLRAGVIDHGLKPFRDTSALELAQACFGNSKDTMDEIADRLVACYQNNADDLMRLPLPPHEALFMANTIALWELRPWLLGDNPCTVSATVFVSDQGSPENFKDYMLDLTKPTPVYAEGKLVSMGNTEDIFNSIERLFRYNRHLEPELYELADRLGFGIECNSVEEWDLLSILEVMMIGLRKADEVGFDAIKTVNTAVRAIYA